MAEEWIAINKEHATAEDFQKLLALTMRELGHNLGLEISGSLIEIRGLADLAVLEHSSTVLFAVHLLVTSNFSEIRDWIAKLCEEQRVFSIFVLRDESSVRDFAKCCDQVPVFVVGTPDAAQVIVNCLTTAPHYVIQQAINHDEVGLQYLQGYPT